MRIAATALLLLYAVLLFRNTSLAAGGPDESGYMNASRMFASGRLHLEVTPLRTLGLDPSWLEVFTPLGFKRFDDQFIVPSYPPGLPLHLIVMSYYTAPILAIGCLLLTFFLGRELGLPPPFAMAGAAILAATGQFLLFALQVMSDVPATFWALLTIVLALRCHPERSEGPPDLAGGPTPSSRLRMTPYLAGAAFAIGVAVRPSNVLIAIPLVFALRGVPQMARAAAGALPFIVALLWYQNATYGSAFTTGYGTVGEVTSLDGYLDKIGFYSRWMARSVLAPLGLLVLFNRGVDRSHRAMLVSWYLAFLLFYGLWARFDEWWYTRFLLPATPPLIIGALLVIRDAVPRRTVAAILVLVMLYVPWQFSSDRRVLRIDDDQKVYTGAMEWSAKLIPDDAMVISGVLSGAFLLYQDRFTARWDSLDPQRFAVVRNRAPWYAVLSDVELDRAGLESRAPGQWFPISRFRDVTLYRCMGCPIVAER